MQETVYPSSKLQGRDWNGLEWNGSDVGEGDGDRERERNDGKRRDRVRGEGMK